MRAVDLNNRTADAQLSIEIDNPGRGFKLKHLSYRLMLNEKQAAAGKYDKEIEIPAHSSTTFELPCSVDLPALPGVAWAVISKGFEAHYELATEFTVPIFGPLKHKVKTSIAGDLSLAETVTGWTAKIKERIVSK